MTGQYINTFVRESLTCSECDAEVNPKRHALGYNVCLECGEIMARDVKHCIVPLHKSNYTVITRKSDLVGINNKQPSQGFPNTT